MAWDKPSPSLTTQFYGFGNGRYGHPDQDRAISLREGALLQGFPADYKFVETSNEVHFRKLGRLIGNAVPVKLGEVIGKTIIEHANSCTPDNSVTKRLKQPKIEAKLDTTSQKLHLEDQL